MSSGKNEGRRRVHHTPQKSGTAGCEHDHESSGNGAVGATGQSPNGRGLNHTSPLRRSRLGYDDEGGKKRIRTPLQLWWMRLRQRPLCDEVIRRWRKQDRVVRVAIVAVLLVSVMLSLSSRESGGRGRRGRGRGSANPRATAARRALLAPSVGRRPVGASDLPLLFAPSLGDGGGLGFSGWTTEPASLSDESRKSAERPSYGGLEFDSLKSGEERKILAQYESGMAYVKQTRHRKKSPHVGHYYAVDDDYVKGRNDVTGSHTCKRTAFHRMYHPNCNGFHEIDMLGDPGEYISRGHFRAVWGLDLEDGEKIVLKVMRLKKNYHDFNDEFFTYTRMDALVMERMTSSPRIVNMYGHCAASVKTEQMVQEVEQFVVPGDGYAKQKDLGDEDDVRPRNNFTPTEKLHLALSMAESIADLHGHADGVIVHDDIQLCQFLYNAQGHLKLNDFNRAEIMLWDTQEQEYCRYRNGKVYGNYRAPEEDSDKPLNEKIDVYSMGNNIYGLLTGLWVYYENEDDQVVQSKVKRGVLPYIDDRYRTRSYAEGALVKIMLRCWKYNPDERADIFEVVDFLRAAVEENTRRSAREKH